MNTAEEVQLALTVLLAGLVVVFAVLIFLTLIIKWYGSAVYAVSQKKKAPTEAKPVSVTAPQPAVPATPVPAVEEGISGDVLAAIAAAVYMTYEDSSNPLAIKSVKRVGPAGPRSVWGAAGRFENTRPF